MIRKMKGLQLGVLVGGMMVTLAMAASGPVEGAGAEARSPRVAADTPEMAGRYLVIVGGCNDCHTPGWMETNGEIPESAWLTGAAVGFQGPWGTSYPANLRLKVQTMTEEGFLARAKAGAGLPPMPWVNLTKMSDEDLRSIYRFIRSLGPAGEHAPLPVAPGVEPGTPYIPFVPVFPEGAGAR